jgi:EAL domain-containing protein (putative c-di-GMP-specific phosphodiesterase class I)/cellobiose-specific phosphotransferase system component IIC
VTAKRKWVRYIVLLQEAFGAVMPFLFLLSTLVLLRVVLSYFHVIPHEYVHALTRTTSAFLRFSALMISLSIAYFLSVQLKQVHVIAITLTAAIYSTLVLIQSSNPHQYLLPGFSFAMLYAPVTAVFFLRLLFPYLSLRIPLHDSNRHVFLLLNYLLVFVVAYAISVSIYDGVDWLTGRLYSEIHSVLLSWNKALYFALRSLSIHLLWFIGIPGENVSSILFPYKDFTASIVPHLSWLEFNRLFINIGGAGAGLAILLATIFVPKTRTLNTIIIISIPLAIFNINTLLLYALIVLNRHLLIPFLLVPMINLLLAYLFVSYFPLIFDGDFRVLWNTPFLFDGYFKTNGNMIVVVFQLILLAIDTAIYSPFIRHFVSTQLIPNHLTRLAEKFDLHCEIEAEKNIQSYQAYRDLLNANARVETILHDLKLDNIYIYYQPKINVADETCTEFEALIRYRHNGELQGPIFLEALEKAGMGPIIDFWVCTQVHNDLVNWKQSGFTPMVSINLNPDTLLNTRAIERIRALFKDEVVMFEILERTFIQNDKAMANLKKLKSDNHRISIDDFGIGYSNLWILFSLEAEELKLDKSLIEKIHESKAFYMCQSIVDFSHKIGMTVVAEGVETAEQLSIVKDLQVDRIQGFYYSRAIAKNKVYGYCQNVTIAEDTADDTDTSTPQI